jgi:glycosyltransferase involved in cell wall biosynthesis
MKSVFKSKSDCKKFKIYCVCGGFGFPRGTASTKRIRLIGKSLISKGLPFHVLHIGPSPFRENTQPRGSFDGIRFEYLSPSVEWPDVYLIRLLFYLWGSFFLFARLVKYQKNSMVYCYYQGGFMNLWTLLICKLLKIPVVQEVCEWWPGTANETFFIKWMYHQVMFRLSDGALPISKLIEDRILSLAGPKYPLCKIPVLVDPNENGKSIRRTKTKTSTASLLWCGMVDGYKRDIFFLLDAISKMKSSRGQKAIFKIVGPCSIKARTDLVFYARNKNIPEERIAIVGYVSDSELWEYCMQADALLMPMWEDDRSNTRFPTKLGQYLAAGKPIVTAYVGEIKHFLSSETAIFYKLGDSTSLSLALDFLLDDPFLGISLAACATETVLPKIDYLSNSLRISQWFCKIYSGKKDGNG